MADFDSGFNAAYYLAIYSSVNMAVHYHKFVGLILEKIKLRELVECGSLKTLFFKN
ncbi:hypothetical protein PGW91_08435 [Fusobacterium nucleatum]|nr:hypothetical protein [Fusobacterium nucleatum]WCB31947.1 hypothetical protein PGW91_08435 [Fusobacterium nucleatum]